ncbi:carbohydrate ABC transporter ATP-binding protein (CUT1 family) [Rhizobium sp. PP-F2F-G38]|uniref:ABC transporter ATP-binding protein n=1 Tax=Ferranicluibacter rubi TaxID=2715133 RepID=A0AA43ZG23_9HYPH|nr:ABC transporter ATP-binding protein [Ferranicluibacter rubi]PYE32556.1 carbohydrate ABC transporter ATP-binding protein (CUT1 family) [Rhizobium sp. PP-WC-1G-195]PYE95985.1 carbohydrate ABC transporter ATP-binding protein (CUT1 family) [Rhizobium sp. PP-F2F-G38]TCP88410.1 carbohydrate ABC transporter ATP-binding protein (CUT1 family) [Rhizobium sp. PP-CC-2G-626]TCQ22925.1 carbohydrate ABC transporter ATP-binding protein (CUT1 family) [Rhizobium sp. PP-CC-3G-465]NHT75766.1 ABC transporter AT
MSLAQDARVPVWPGGATAGPDGEDGAATGGVRLSGVRKSFGSLDIIHGIDLSIPEGAFTVFVGPSGCGKSTLLRMIAGLEEVSDGLIAIKGRDVTDLDPSDRGIAMVFQSYALYPHMSVRDNLAFGLKMANTPKAEIDRRVAAASAILKTDRLLDRRPGQLSGGQRQRVAIGRAIVRKPDVFLFDEPLSNLDAELRVSMRIEIARLHRELGNTMIYVTHDQTEAMTLADMIVVLREGRIEQVGSPREIYENPANSFVAGFIGSPRMNLLKAKRVGPESLELADAMLAAPFPTASGDHEEDVTFGIRPEHLTVGHEIVDGRSLTATIDFSEYLGGTQYLYCQLADRQTVTVEYRSPDTVKPGDRIVLSWSPDAIRLFNAAGLRLRQDI